MKKYTLAIVGGCGHVGLPLGIALAQAGAEVTLVDTDEVRLASVMAGNMPFREFGAEGLLPDTLATGRLRCSTSADAIADSDSVIVTVGTPIDEFLDPDIRAFDQALEGVLTSMRDGQLLILRSTVFPGLTERLARRVRDSGLRIDVAHCPERIAQGYALDELKKLPQIIGGTTPQAARRASELFELLGIKIINLSPTEAELAKLFANGYRYINFAISNQFYMMAQKFGADFARIHEAVTDGYPRLSGFAGAGFAGGPCLLKDTMQLAAFNHNEFVLGQAAMMINEGLPTYLVKVAKKQMNLADKAAAILGMAFKGNSDDPRDSLAYKLRKLLTIECRRVLCTDEYIRDPTFVSLGTALREADILFLGACHDAYRDVKIDKPVIDVFHFLKGAA